MLTTDMHSLGIIHTDLKPDNIVVKYSDTTVVQWLDPLSGFHDKVRPCFVTGVAGY